MNIWFDIDETLTNSITFGQKFGLDYIAKNNLPFKLVNRHTYLLSDMFDWPMDVFEKFFEEKGGEFFDNIPMRTSAKEVIDELRQRGHKIFIISKRFYFNPLVRSQTWLNKHNIYYDKLIVEAGEKLEACKENKIDYFVDDSIEVCDLLNSNNIKAYLINTVCNQEEKTISPRVDSLTDFKNIVIFNESQK